MENITLESATEFIIKCISFGQSKGAYSIKHASQLYKTILEFKKEGGKNRDNYGELLRAVVIANGKGAFSLEEAATIERVVEFLDNEIEVNESDK